MHTSLNAFKSKLCAILFFYVTVFLHLHFCTYVVLYCVYVVILCAGDHFVQAFSLLCILSLDKLIIIIIHTYLHTHTHTLFRKQFQEIGRMSGLKK